MFSDNQSAAAQPNVGSLRILIVDDDPAASDTLRRILTRRGHVARELNEATSVVAEALEFRPHVVILDFLMPHCDGAAVAWQLAMHPELRQVRVVVASGYSREEISKTLPPSVIPVMPKPIDMDALLRLLDDEARGPLETF